MTSRPGPTAFILLTSLLIALACGGPAPSSTSSKPPPSVPATLPGGDLHHACTLVTNQEVSAAVGETITQTNAPTDADSCRFYSDAGAKAITPSFALDLTPHGGKAEFDANRAGSQPLTGIGDGAYLQKNIANIVELDLLYHDVRVSMWPQFHAQRKLTTDDYRQLGLKAAARVAGAPPV